MNWHLQLELKRDLRCRLAVPFVYVSRFHISGHWDPDALARWHTMMSYLVSFLELHPPPAEGTAGVQDCAGKLMVKLGLV